MTPFSSHPSLKNKKILVIVAHPDDECLYFYGGLKALSKSSEITVLSATQSRWGVRARELRAACEILGIRCQFLELPDSGFNSLLPNLDRSFEAYMAHRQFDLIITHPPHGGEKPHPHHLQVFLMSLLFCLKNRYRFGFFSECSRSLCANLKSDTLTKLTALPLVFLLTLKTLHLLSWKYRLQWFSNIGKKIFSAIFQFGFHGLIFRKFEIDSPVLEKKKILKTFASQSSVLNSYKTSSLDKEYLFLLKSPDSSEMQDTQSQDLNLTYYN